MWCLLRDLWDTNKASSSFKNLLVSYSLPFWIVLRIFLEYLLNNNPEPRLLYQLTPYKVGISYSESNYVDSSNYSKSSVLSKNL